MPILAQYGHAGWAVHGSAFNGFWPYPSRIGGARSVVPIGSSWVTLCRIQLPKILGQNSSVSGGLTRFQPAYAHQVKDSRSGMTHGGQTE